MQRSMWLCFLLLASCITKQQPRVKQCFCGPLLSTSQKDECGLWEKDKPPLAKHPPVLQSAKGSCSPPICKKLAKNLCQKIYRWPYPKSLNAGRPATDLPCYCDQLVIQVGSKTETVCAAWVPGESTLLEYFSLNPCHVDSCEKKPFVIAKSHCQLGFVSFYQGQDPINNQTTTSGEP